MYIATATRTRAQPPYACFAGVQLHLAKKALHSAKSCRHIPSRQRLLCRVPHVGHSAKIYTRQNENAKKPKTNSKIFQIFFFRGDHHQPTPTRLHRSRCIFCTKFGANADGGIRTHDLSLTGLLLYHCTTLSLVSRFRYLSSYIIQNRE